MTEDLANIDETKRALQDIRLDREKLQRMMNPLADFKYTDEQKSKEDAQMALLYAQRIKQSITDQIQMEDLLTKHLEAMGGR